MLWFANGHRDVWKSSWMCNTRFQAGETLKRVGVQPIELWIHRGHSGRAPAVQRLRQLLTQSLRSFLAQRPLLKISDVEHVLGPLSDGHDFGVMQLQVQLHQHFTDVTQQARAVSSGELENRTTVTVVNVQLYLCGRVEHARLSRYATGYREGCVFRPLQ